MINPFEKDTLIEARLNARLTPDRVKAMQEAKHPVYVAKFIHVGACGYREQNDITYVSAEALAKMQDTFIGRPVILSPHDLNITSDNLNEKAKGYVVDCWTEDNNEWFVKFVVMDEKTNKKIAEQGYNFVSCAYLITEAGEPEVHDGLNCTTVVKDGFYHHLAITNSPRYDDSQVWRMNENNDLKNVQISDIVKLNGMEETDVLTKGKTMFGFKKVEASIDENLHFDTAMGRLNTADMIDTIATLKENCDSKDAKIAELEEKVSNLEAKAEPVTEEVVASEEAEKTEVSEEPVAEEKTEAAVEEQSHEASTVIQEAAMKANESAAQSEVIKEAIPKENEDNPRVATCTVRGLSAKRN